MLPIAKQTAEALEAAHEQGIIIKAASQPNALPPQIVVVQHFYEELKRLVATK